ncbi:MAG: sulfite exporter TauE/SafE family protein [Acidobacteriota bacterium]
MLTGLDGFIALDVSAVLQVIALGFIGGVLSGFIGSGGAFFMTPGMMNLGVPGIIAVGSNITHKFGKALVGSRKHCELGHVDHRLAAFMIATSFIGIQFAVWVNTRLFDAGGDGHGGSSGSAAGDLYISVVFVTVLSVVGASVMHEVWRTLRGREAQASRLASVLSNLSLPPIIHFRVSETRVSLWLILIIGLAVGYMAGTIGVGGFLGVPAMIYLFGVPTAVAAGTELYLAMFMGGFGCLSYAWQGMVDIRLTLLLYAGSLFGIFVGTYGTKIVRQVMIRLVTAVVILVCVLSRAVAIPIYLHHLGMVSLDAGADAYLNAVSKGLLFAAGLAGLAMILTLVVKAHRQRLAVQAAISGSRTLVPRAGS